MKKFVSMILSIVLVISVFAPAAYAAQGGCSCGVLPMIYVGPLGNTDIYENPGTENERVLFRPRTDTILSIVGKVLPAAVVLALTKDYERFGDVLISAVDDAMGAMKLDGDGNSAPNVSVKLELPDDPNHEKGTSYYFHYDWRLDPIEIAGQLNEYVQHIKKLTGHDKVNFRASSMGGVITMAYFNEYGYDDVDACVFQSCPILGTADAGDVLCRKLKLDSKALLDYGTDAYPPSDAESTALWLLFNFLYYSGTVDAVISLGDKLLEKLETKVFDELLTPVFGTMLGLWALTPDETYEQAKSINLDPETQAGIIERADYYHYRVQARADEILNGAVESGVRVMIVAGYDIQRTPLVESMNSDSDSIVDVKYASAGATAAPIDGTLGEGYVQKVDCGHNHISPDGRIDASTCILPENTWFIKGMLHSNAHDGIKAMYDWFVYSDESCNVWSNPNYPQFLQNDKPNGRVIPMGNFAQGVSAPTVEPGSSFHDGFVKYVEPITDKVFAFLDKIRAAV